MSSKLKAITTKAKALYKTGKYKKWTDAIKAASKTLPATKKAKVGDYTINESIFMEKGGIKERKIKPKKTKGYVVERNKKGEFKKIERIAGIKKKAAPKKKAATKKKATTIHKDSKSHNVKISVVSGVPKNKKYNLFAHIQKMNGNTERLHYFYFEKLNDAKNK